MPELQDFLKKVDIPEEEIKDYVEGKKTVDDFSKHLQETYVARKVALDDEKLRSDITGQVTGGMQTVLKNKFGFTKDQMKGKKWEELLEMGMNPILDELKELKESSGKDADERVKKLSTELETYKTKYNDYEGQLLNANKTIEQVKADSEAKLNDYKIDTHISGIKSNITWKDGLSELEKVGFDSYIKQNFKSEINGDKIIPLNADGTKVLNDNKTDVMDWKSLLERKASEFGLLKMNTGKTTTQTNKFEKRELPKTEVKFHPNAQKHRATLGL